MQTLFSLKKCKSKHNAHTAFFRGVVYKISLALLNFGHLFFVHFRGAMPFLFWTFLKRNNIFKGYKGGKFPQVGN
jgi:hypothetical protein